MSIRTGAISGVLTAVFLALVAIAPSDAAERPVQPIVAAAVNNSDAGEKGAGFVIRNGDLCLLVTAAHVVKEGTEIEVAAIDQPVIKASSKIFDPDGRLDVALLPLSRPVETCPQPPSENDIRRAVQGGQGVLLVALGGGQQLPVPVMVGKVSDNQIDIKSASQMVQIQAGMSGAVLVMSDTPVAILSNTETRDDGYAAAVRLDYAARVLGPRVISLTVVIVQNGDEIARANDIIQNAINNRPLVDMGQVDALQTLAAAKKGAAGLDLQGVAFPKLNVGELQANEVNLNLANLTQARITSSNLANADLTFANLTAANFSGSNLDGVLAVFAQAPNADFSKTSLKKASWLGAKLAETSFRGAVLDGASFAFADLRNADFRGAKFDHIVLAGSDLRGAHFDQSRAAVRSIDVTAALFSDDTFSSELQSKLCASLPSGGVNIEAVEKRKSGYYADGFSYENIAKYLKSLPLSKQDIRFFPECPLRDGEVAETARSMIWSNTATDTAFAEDRVRDGKPAETPFLAETIRADISSDLADKGGRRTHVHTTVETFINEYNARYALLAKSNRFYRDRSAQIVRAIQANSATKAPPKTVRFNSDVKSLINRHFMTDEKRVLYAAEARLEFEQDLRRNFPGRENQLSNWPQLFPSTTVSDDLEGEVLAAFGRWNAARWDNLRGQTLVIPHDRATMKPITINEIMAVYDPASPDEVNRNQAVRKRDCERLRDLEQNARGGPEYNALAKKLGYFGALIPGIEWCTDFKWRADKPKVPNPSWYKPGIAILQLNFDRFLRFILVFEGTVPDYVENDKYGGQPLSLHGRVEDIISLPPVAGKADVEPQIVIRLSNVSFRKEDAKK